MELNGYPPIKPEDIKQAIYYYEGSGYWPACYLKAENTGHVLIQYVYAKPFEPPVSCVKSNWN